MEEVIGLPYTICFCIRGKEVLMLYRDRSPNQYLWNGLGGKIEANEPPEKSILREVWEEAEIDLNQSLGVYYAGIVTWSPIDGDSNKSKGMYAYIAEFPVSSIKWDKKTTAEGELEWKKLSWVCDKSNIKVVENIPYFLPIMLKKQKPVRFHCKYKGEDIQKMVIKSLPIITNLI